MTVPADGTRDPTPEAQRPAFAVGDAVPGLSSWVLERHLGGGGFGEVWLVKHEWKDERRAVKFCTHPTARSRLVTHEKEIVVRVMRSAGNHPNIVPLLDYNLSGDIPWLMYEFVEGGTLAEAIERWRLLAPDERIDRAVRTLRTLAAALGSFHRLKPPIVHRDMKPHNVLMAGETPRITDFGIGSVVIEAAISDSPGVRPSTPLPSMLSTSGSFLYAGPEQLFGSPPNPRDDVFALGVIAYQMITGDLTYAPGTDALNELRALNVPAGLVALIMTSVALNADQRPKDAGAWVATLNALPKRVRQEPPPAPKTETPSGRSLTSVGLIPLVCSSCGGRFRVRREFAGKEAKCIHCQGTVKVPAN